MGSEAKIKDRADLRKILEEKKGLGKKIVFTNGCFDILHIGHVSYLEEAKGLGDILVVAINSDSSARKIKGAGRPIVPQDERAGILAALESVDYVAMFDELDPYAIIKELLPDVLAKGGDWSKDAIIGRDIVEARGGTVCTIPIVEGISTSKIIDRILKGQEIIQEDLTSPSSSMA